MYQKVGAVTAAGATSGLAYTGVNVVWLALAGFALLAAGAALLRIAPVMRRRKAF
ncbi:MAG TPA: peptidase [Amycolatopsis sp.]|nr:peptidase [Amycolatopsis sp.]